MKIPWRRKWPPTPVFLPEKSHGQRSLVVYSPRGHKESDTTEQLTHTTLVSLSPFPAESPQVCPSDVPNFYSHPPSILWWFCFSRLSQEPASFHLIALSLLTASPSAARCCSVAQSYSTLCNPMDCSTPGSPLLHCLRTYSNSYPLGQ